MLFKNKCSIWHIKEKFSALYFEFYKTLKSNFWTTDGYTKKIQLRGRNDHLEVSGKNQSNLVATLFPKVNSKSFLINSLEITFTSEK